ncbi:MAG: UPF0182 family protein [Gemmatimonadaceae bacterium]
MTPGRRLLLGLVAAAAVLLLGRALALVYTDYAWYDALSAAPLWGEKTADLTAIHLFSAVFAGLFALLNLFSIRRSIVSLAFPRRLGNVQFGEAVPSRYLDRTVMALSVAIALLMSAMTPAWEQLALVRTGVRFGEADPFFQTDLSFYIAWLPLEWAAYEWTLGLLIVVSAVVIGLYALTPSLRWELGAFRLSVHVRRHLSVLGALFLLVMAWSYRLDGYHLLVNGTGPNGTFSYLDHQWLIPAYLSLSIITMASAVLVFVSGWTGQLRTIFFTVSALLIVAITFDFALPAVARRYASTGDDVHQQPYAATRAAFTRRAYNDTTSGIVVGHEVARFASFGDTARTAVLLNEQRGRLLVYPGARGAAIVTHSGPIPAPELGSGLTQLAQAWAEQRLDLLWGPYPSDARIARRRDVRERVHALAPIFAQGSVIAPAFLGDTLIWVVELYSASSWYPLSAHATIAEEDRSYFRHASTALVNSRTGRVVVVSDQAPDPTTVAWRAKFPGMFRPGRPDILDVLTINPAGNQLGATPPRRFPAEPDSAFRRDVIRLYSRMRQALFSGDLKAFGAAYDSLGEILRRD